MSDLYNRFSNSLNRAAVHTQNRMPNPGRFPTRECNLLTAEDFASIPSMPLWLAKLMALDRMSALDEFDADETIAAAMAHRQALVKRRKLDKELTTGGDDESDAH